jgi:isopenicillin-N epimerase
MEPSRRLTRRLFIDGARMMRADSDAQDWAACWESTGDAIYLNHGSFGRAPRTVLDAQAHWTAELQRNPMDFFTRRLDGLLDTAAEKMARFVGCKAGDLVFVPNATVAMNVVAANVPLEPGDEVLLNDHEYGAVSRIWRTRCQQAGASVVTARLPDPLKSHHDIVEALFAAVTERTRLIVISQVTSPTALVFPAQEICARAHAAGIRVCIDGPHALAMRPLNLEMLGCDFYCVSCHKWLAAPIGSGWLYVRGGLKNHLHPTTLSWGRSLCGRPSTWKDEFHWPGTYDPAAYLATGAAIEFLSMVGLDTFRSTTHTLARHARERLVNELGAQPISPDGPDWYGSMVTVRLPWAKSRETGAVFAHPLQQQLWEQFRIEIPILQLNGHVHVRVSCHLYTSEDHIDRLVSGLKTLRG